MTTRKAFTLVELLVVVTIIVVLLAMLMPAMSKAVYQAQLTSCGSQLRAMAQGLVNYSFDAKKFYPNRKVSNGTQPATLTEALSVDYDFRPTLKKAFDLKLLHDPLTPPVDVTINMEGVSTQANHNCFAPYNIWAGFNYPGRPGMDKVGDRFEWSYGGLTQSFSLLASDRDLVLVGANQIQSGHPDYQQTLNPVSLTYSDQDPFNEGTVWKVPGNKLTIALWFMKFNYRRGPVDDNFAYDDLSVRRENTVLARSTYSEGMTGVGIFRQHANLNNTTQNWIYVPRE